MQRVVGGPTIMFTSEIQKARSGMRLATGIGIIVLAATLWAVMLWTLGEIGGWISNGLMASAALGVVVVAWIVGAWLRNRQRRRLMDTRDSALW